MKSKCCNLDQILPKESGAQINNFRAYRGLEKVQLIARITPNHSCNIVNNEECPHIYKFGQGRYCVHESLIIKDLQKNKEDIRKYQIEIK